MKQNLEVSSPRVNHTIWFKLHPRFIPNDQQHLAVPKQKYQASIENKFWIGLKVAEFFVKRINEMLPFYGVHYQISTKTVHNVQPKYTTKHSA